MEDGYTQPVQVQGKPGRHGIYRAERHSIPAGPPPPCGSRGKVFALEVQLKLPKLADSDEVEDQSTDDRGLTLPSHRPKVSDSVSSMERCMQLLQPAPAKREEELGDDSAKGRGPLHQRRGAGTSRGAACAPRMQPWVCSMYSLPPYVDQDLCCAGSLGIANSIMQASTLPGLSLGSFLSVSGGSLLFYLGASWGFTAMTIALGSSYFQRLCHRVPSLEWAAQRHSNFAAYAAPRTSARDADQEACYLVSHEYKSRELTLMGVLFTCVSIASKNVDRVGHPGILRYMLGKIYGVPVTADHAYDVENKCLDGLNWQLGPYYVDDALEDTWVAWVPE